MITNHYFLRYVSIALIAFVCASCGSETNKETVAEVPKITKTSFQASPATIKEVIVPPTLSLIESPALNENNLVAFGFRSSKAGIISYSGSCFGSTRNAIKGAHHILFVTMVEGSYDDCAIQVTDSEGNTSDPLQVPAFKVDFTSPKLSQVGDFRVQGRNVEMEIKASESGILVYSGNCSGDLQHMKHGKSEVSISFPGDGQYSDCELTLRDASGNTSEPCPSAQSVSMLHPRFSQRSSLFRKRSKQSVRATHSKPPSQGHSPSAASAGATLIRQLSVSTILHC